MSTAGEIIDQSFREANFVAVGATPTAAQEAEALLRLHALTMSLLGRELGTPLRDWSVPESWTAAQETSHPLTPLSESTSTTPFAYPPSNSRLIVTISTARTVYFPGNPRDGARMALTNVGSGAVTLTLSGNGRLVEGATTLAATPATLHGRSWLYRADLSDWIRVNDITTDAVEMPLADDFDDLFVTGLCLRLAPRYGVDPKPGIAERYADMLARAVERYRPEARPLTAAELRTTLRVTP